MGSAGLTRMVGQASYLQRCLYRLYLETVSAFAAAKNSLSIKLKNWPTPWKKRKLRDSCHTASGTRTRRSLHTIHGCEYSNTKNGKVKLSGESHDRGHKLRARDILHSTHTHHYPASRRCAKECSRHVKCAVHLGGAFERARVERHRRWGADPSRGLIRRNDKVSRSSWSIPSDPTWWLLNTGSAIPLKSGLGNQRKIEMSVRSEKRKHGKCCHPTNLLCLLCP